MGTRLNVRYPDNDRIVYDGTKMYGYISEDIFKNLSSFKYLKDELGLFTDEEAEEFILIVTVANGSDDEYELSAEEFDKFIRLYNADYQTHHPSYIIPHDLLQEHEIQELLRSPKSKVISWG